MRGYTEIKVSKRCRRNGNNSIEKELNCENSNFQFVEISMHGQEKRECGNQSVKQQEVRVCALPFDLILLIDLNIHRHANV